MSSYYSDEDDVDIHVRHRGHSPQPVRYVQTPPRVRSYYGVPTGPSYLVPEQHTTVVARARSRDRSRDRRASPPVAVPVPPPAPAPVPAPANPVIINNRIYTEHSSEDDDSDNGSRRYSRKQLARRRRSRSDSRSRSRSRSQSRTRTQRLTREAWEAEQARRELEQLRITQEREKDERRLAKEYRNEAEFRLAVRELDEIKKREAQANEENRIKKELELKRLKEEEEAAEKKRRKDKAAQEAVEKYKREELERIAREEKQRAENDREYKRRLREDLIKSGLDEKAISAILNNQKIPEPPKNPQPPKDPQPPVEQAPAERPTYTRMARKHLSIETLRTFRIEYDLDADPDFVLIKRWVPEWEQDQFWRHTKLIREKRGKALLIEEKKHHSREPEFEWVRKKSDRRRSKSPALLMYLAGGRPA